MELNKGMEYEDLLMRNQQYAAEIERQVAEIKKIKRKIAISKKRVRSLKDEIEGWIEIYFTYRASVTNRTVEEAHEDFFNEFMAKIPLIDCKEPKDEYK